ncbi:MAG TPA: LysR family transcriptional regulator [Burkholderiaceae bacterium]|nr:LysR family transcriptional regulator [Burkholderiaceae bacterium]
MKLTQLDGMAAFVEVATRRSFTAAAAALDVTPPAVSQAVKLLEERLGVRLLHRTTRSVGLTEAGAEFFARAAPAVAELADAAHALDAHRGGPSGLLRINAPFVLHETLLRPMLPRFLSAYPAVRVELTLNDSFVDIVADGFDAGLRLGESIARDMVAARLTERERCGLVASPAYARRHGLPQRIEELADHACIRHRLAASGVIYRWELMRRGRRIEVEVDGPLTVSDSVSGSRAALDGIGIAYVFERQVARDLAAGRLLPVLEASWPTLDGFHFYYPSRRQVPPKLRVFIEHCRAAAALHA